MALDPFADFPDAPGTGGADPFADFPDAGSSGEPVAEDPGVWSELKRGYMQGALEVERQAGVAMQKILPRWAPNEQLARDTQQRTAELAPQYERPQSVTDMPWYAPTRIAGNVGQAGASMGPGLAIGAGLAATGVGALPAAVVAGGIAGYQEAESFYRQRLAEGIPEPQAFKEALIAFPAIGALNVLPFKRILGRTPGRLMTAGVEAATEIAEEPVQALIAGKDPIAATIEGAKEVGPAAAILGFAGGAGGASQSTTVEREQFRERVAQADPFAEFPDADLEQVRAAYPAPESPPALPAPPDFTVDVRGRAARPGEARPDDLALPAPQASGEYQVTREGVSVPLTQATAQALGEQRRERADLGLGEAERIAWRRAMPTELEAAPESVSVSMPEMLPNEGSIQGIPAPEPLLERVRTDPDLHQSFAALAKETGWDTIGGRSMGKAGPGLPGQKDVEGSTPWLPRYPWFKDVPTDDRGKRLSEKAIKRVIALVLGGKPLGVQHQRVADYLAEVAADRIKAVPYQPAPDILAASQLEDNGTDADETALVARAAELDDAVVERLAIQYENDNDAFLRAVRTFLDSQAAPALERSAGSVTQEARQPAAINRDLFAGSDQASESLARRNAVEAEKARRDAARTGDVLVETGNPIDLFSQARRQTDLADSANAESVRSVFAAARDIAEGAEEATVIGLRPDLVALGGSPDVVLRWGDAKQFGLAKIGALRGARVVRGVLEAVALGSISRFSAIKKTVVLAQRDMRAVLSLDEHGAQRTWLLTGWEEGKPDDPGQVSTESGTTQRTPTFSRDALGAGLVDSRSREGVDSNPGSSRPGSGTMLYSNPIEGMFRVGQGMFRQATRANERAERLFGTEPPPVQPQPAEDIPDKVKAGGGTYTTAPIQGMDPATQRVILDVMAAEEANIAHERGNDGEPITWSQTGSEAQALLDGAFGRTFNSLVNRLPRSTANAKLLESFARIVNTAGKNVQAAVEQYSRTNSAQDLAHLNAAREQLGVVLAPFMGYRTEAGRALNILRKVQADFADAQAIFDALGDGNESAMKDFARRVKAAGSVAEVLELTRASYHPTALDQFREYWINSILSGPWTHVVNIASNTAFNLLDAATELGVSVVSNKVSTRAALARFTGMMAGLQLGMVNARKAFATEDPQLNQSAQIESRKHQAIPGKLGRFVRLPGRLLMAEDEFAKAVTYTGTLYRMAMEEAVTQNPRDPYAVFDQILAGYANNRAVKGRAKAEADRLTFQTPLGKLGQNFMRLRDETKVGFLVAPFIRTPTNILKQAATYSPAALAMPSVREQLKAGDRDKHIALGRMLIGSTFMFSMAGLVLQGMMTGAGPDDPGERAIWMRTGKKPYSIKVDDEWVRYNRFEPIGMLMGIAADMAELSATVGKGQYDRIATMVWSSIMLNLADKTYLRGLFDAIEAANDPKRYLARWLSNMAGGVVVPNIVAQGARATDPFVRDARGIIDTLKGRVPGLRQSLPAKLDIAGEPIERSIFEPAASTPERDDPLAQAMLSLGVFKRPPGRTINMRGRSLELTSEQYASLAEFVQRTRWENLTPIVQSDNFGRMAASDPLRAQMVLGNAYDRIGEAARLMWLQQNKSILDDLRAAPLRRREPSNYAEARP